MTTSNGRVQTQDVEGMVEAVNANGLKLGGSWLNVSQYHPVELPETGAHVRLKIDAKGYIRELEELPTVLSRTPAVVSDRDERITRLAVLKAAAAFCGAYATAHEEVKSSDVLKIADAWITWVQSDG